MVTETERDDALATLLIEQVETTRQAQLGPSRTGHEAADRSRRDRWRIGITTGAVLVAVVAVTVLALTLQRPATPTPAAPTATAAMPTPGQVLATFTSTDGHNQTRTITPNGAALEIVYRCTGEGQIAVTITHGPSFNGTNCEGPVTASSPTGVPGSEPVTVSSTGSAKWTVTVRVIDPN